MEAEARPVAFGERAPMSWSNDRNRNLVARSSRGQSRDDDCYVGPELGDHASEHRPDHDLRRDKWPLHGRFPAHTRYRALHDKENPDSNTTADLALVQSEGVLQTIA